MKLDRLLAIVILLLEKKTLSASEMAKRFSVSIRTIQRDMDALNLAGIPIYSLPGQSGGYGILPNYKINNHLISNDDILNFITALKSIQGTFADKRFLGALEQIYSLIPAQIHEKVLERENTLIIDYSLTSNDTILKNKIKTIEHAINQRNIINCSYTSNKNEMVPRRLEPMTLILQWGSWYLFAFCRLRSDFRLFKISRIHDISIEPEHFIRRDKTYQDFLSDQPEFKNSNIINLVFIVDASARAFVEENHHSQELEYQENGSIIVRCRQPEEERMYRYLLSYGNSIKVLEPLYIKDRIQNIAKEILLNYDILLS